MTIKPIMLKRGRGTINSYRKVFNLSLILPVIIYVFETPSLSFGTDVRVFEETFVRGHGPPQTEQRNFTAVAGEGSLIIHNGDPSGHHRVTGAVIILNGTQVVGPNEFNQQIEFIRKPVALNLNNTLEVELRSAPGSFINVQIGEFPLTFTVSSARSEYALSEPVRLTLTLTLNPRFLGEMTVNTFDAGTISVISATRDGEPINPTRGGGVRFDGDPVLTQIASLRTISAGDHATIPFIVPHVSNQESKLVVDELDPVANLALIYPLTQPGLYRLQFLYHYTGPDGGKPNVIRDRILSNKISFRLR